MAEKSSMKVPEFLREPFEAAQVRFAEFEEEAQKVLKDLIQKGKEGRRDMAVFVQRLSHQDWGIEDLRKSMTKFRQESLERAQELAGKAETFRAEALEKLEELQTKTVNFLGAATREEVEDLSRELARLARRIDKNGKPVKARKTARRPTARA